MAQDDYRNVPPGFPSTGLPRGYDRHHPPEPGFSWPHPAHYNVTSGPYKPNVTYENPTGAVPGPLATENRAYWTDGQKILQFGNPALAPLNRAAYAFGRVNPVSRAIWQSSVLDLRPDLRASASADNMLATAISRGGAFGAGARMDVHAIATPTLQNIAGRMNVYCLDEVHIQDPAFVSAIGTPRNITADFFDGVEGCLLTFLPPGNPVRYWRVDIIFDWLGNAGDEPSIVTWASAQ